MRNLNDLTNDEKTLRRIIIDLRNELIGGAENCFLDNELEEFEHYVGKKEKLTKDWAINNIYLSIMKGTDKWITSPFRQIYIERKHVKFLGKTFIMSLIENRVEHDYRTNGWHFPNNYEGGKA